MFEEVYFSDIVEDGIDNNRTLDPWRAYRDDNGYYHFLFPSLWYTSVCNNKAIGLRRIETKAKPKNVSFTLSAWRRHDGTRLSCKKSFNLHFLESDTIDVILSTMCYHINQEPDAVFRTGDLKLYYFNVFYQYNNLKNTVEIFDIRNPINGEGGELDWSDVSYSWGFSDISDDFSSVFNMGGPYRPDNFKVLVPVQDITKLQGFGDYNVNVYRFTNVWNRKFCFVHASFVTGTSFQYLGRSGDFYPKPSKMYQFTGISTDFTLAVSYDGRQPVKTDEIVFVVELAYIYSTGEYMAE